MFIGYLFIFMLLIFYLDKFWLGICLFLSLLFEFCFFDFDECKFDWDCEILIKKCCLNSCYKVCVEFIEGNVLGKGI